MDGRSGWGVMVMVEACGWVEREGKERSRSVLCGHGWCVCGREKEERRRKEGREREGRKQLTA